MENEEVKKIKIGGKKAILVLVGLAILVVITVLVSVFVLSRSQNNVVNSPITEDQELPSSQVKFVPPIIAVESNTPTLYSGKIIFSENIPAKKIFLEILVDPKLVYDVLLSLENSENWILESGFYDGGNGIASIEIRPATGLGTSQTNDAIINIEPTSKDNIQNKEAEFTVSPNSYITLADDKNLQLEGNTLKLLYPNIAPYVE